MLTEDTLLSTILQAKHTRESIVADASLIARVDDIAGKLNFSTRTKALQFLTTFYEDSQRSQAGLQIATYDSLMSTKQGPPVVLAGIPGSGKSYTLDVFLKECKKRKHPFLLFSSRAKDPKATEHAWVPAMNFYEFITLHWLDSPSMYRVELETDLTMRRGQIREAAQALLRLEGDERLSKWVIIVEEAADYFDVKPFATFLRRMRKTCKRILILSTEADLFKMCQPMRPLPF